MAASNLQVGIVIDTSQIRAQRALVEAELKKVTQAMNDAAKANDLPALQAYTQQVDQLARQYRALTKEINEKTRATQADTRANREHGLSIREGAIEVSHFLHTAGLGIEAAKALRFGFAGFLGAEFIRTVNEGITKINELNNAIKAMAPGGDPQVLKAIRESIRATGQDAAIGTKMYEGFLKTWNEAHRKALATGGQTSEGGAVLRGGVGSLQGTIQDVQTVLRGGQQPGAIDWSDPYRALGVTQVKDKVKDQQNLARAILNVKDATLQDDAAQHVFNVTFAEGEKLFRELASRELKIEPGPTPKQNKEIDEYNKHLAETQSLLEAIQTELGTEWATQVNETVAVINNVSRAIATAAKFAYQGIFNLRPTQESRTLSPRDVSQSTRDILSEHETEVHASGGYVRGAGSGTSDSILARLSNGEFVINAASARRLGAGFLQRLNRYASGGNVTGLDYDPSVTDFTGGAPDYRADRPQLSIHERSVLTAAYNKWRAGPGGRKVAPLLAGETDEEYFKRTGYHYGRRPGDPRETPLRVDPRQTPLRVDPRQTPLRVDPRQIPLYFGGGLVTAPPIRFAEGGSVGSASATPVHLHIGGGTYPMSASSGVAAALVGAAKHSQMVSSGIKPSWYGR